jgi:mRNA interferase MazF
MNRESEPQEPLRGEVWDLDLDPVLGREQAGFRPALVLSVDLFNLGPADLVVAVPITRTQRKVRWHVPVRPPEGGLATESFIQCENVRSIPKRRLRRRRGPVSAETLEQVEDRVRILPGLRSSMQTRRYSSENGEPLRFGPG